VKTPRDVSSDRLIRHLTANWGYRVDRQSGSHILIESDEPKRHSIPVPQRKALGQGLFRSILSQVAKAKGVTVGEILRHL
jgi:predicted RNA binding protein YcfA (HicA-like mRNA interferase family)